MNETELDNQFVLLLQEVQEYYPSLERQIQIRIQRWVHKLIASCGTLHPYPKTKITWKKSRNNYLTLLAHQLKFGLLQHPFDKIPEHCDLENMTQHMLRIRTGFKLRDSQRKNKQKNITNEKGKSHPLKQKMNQQTTNTIQNKSKFLKSSYNQNENRNVNLDPRKKSKQKPQDHKLLNKIRKVMKIHKNELMCDPEYQLVMQRLQEEVVPRKTHHRTISISISRNTNSNLKSPIQAEIESHPESQLYVEEGIQRSKTEMFSSKQSPRTQQKQIQYFREAFQLKQ